MTLADWVASLDLRALGYDNPTLGPLSDDCFARALDSLYEADRASLLTRLAVAAIRAFDVRCERIHNDSTSVKACGRIRGSTRTGLELRRGHRKDHRPDLKRPRRHWRNWPRGSMATISSAGGRSCERPKAFSGTAESMDWWICACKRTCGWSGIGHEADLRCRRLSTVYPEDRDAPHPTSSQLFKTFDRLSTYAITQDGQLCEEHHDELTDTHRTVLSLLGIDESRFWK